MLLPGTTMAYYVYPVYVLASLIFLILSIICIIYTLHFYKFVKSRVVFIKLEANVALNTWTFDLYPFTSSRIWKLCGYAIVCLPATFQQASSILVCQCKLVKFKTVLPKSVYDDTNGMVTPVLQKKKFISKSTSKDADGRTEKDASACDNKTLGSLCRNCEKPIMSDVKEENEDDVISEDESVNSETEPLNNNPESNSGNKISVDRSVSSLHNTTVGCEFPREPTPRQNNNNVMEKDTSEREDTITTTATPPPPTTPSTTMVNNKQPCCDKKSKFQRIAERLRRPSRPDARETVINIDPEFTEHNMSIMSIDNSYDTDYFIIPEATSFQQEQHQQQQQHNQQQQTLVIFNEPFNSSCPICLDDFEFDEEIALLTCHHGYHKDCLNKALRQNASCPYCKSESNVRAFRVSEEIPLLWQSLSRRNSQATNL